MSYMSHAFPSLNINTKKISATCKYLTDNVEIIEGLFKKNQIRFSQPWVLNDPIEANPCIDIKIKTMKDINNRYILDDVIIPSYREVIYLNFVESRYNRYGILCLSKNILNYNMWNMYANAHKGFIIDFKMGMDENKTFKSDALISGLVKYVKQYKVVIDRPLDENGYIIYDYLNSDLFLHKTIHWKKEKEYRIIRPLAENPNYTEPEIAKSYRDNNIYLFNFDPYSIASIIFGAAMACEKKKLIIELTEKYGYQYFQCIIDKSDNSKMYYLPIELWKDREEYLNFMPQVFITNGDEFRYFQKHTSVKSIDDIEYCKSKEMRQYSLDYFERKKNNKKLS